MRIPATANSWNWLRQILARSHEAIESPVSARPFASHEISSNPPPVIFLLLAPDGERISAMVADDSPVHFNTVAAWLNSVLPEWVMSEPAPNTVMLGVVMLRIEAMAIVPYPRKIRPPLIAASESMAD